jgi:hypothetical protein
MEMQEVRRHGQSTAPPMEPMEGDLFVNLLRNNWVWDGNNQHWKDVNARRNATEREERRKYDEKRAAVERKREEERKALEAPLGRILDARKRGVAPSVDDRIQLAIDNRNWTPTDIQQWDHAQGFGVILRIKQIDGYLKRGRK